MAFHSIQISNKYCSLHTEILTRITNRKWINILKYCFLHLRVGEYRAALRKDFYKLYHRASQRGVELGTK